MIKFKILFAALFFLESLSSAFAYSWKALHEESSRFGLVEAQKQASSKTASLEDRYLLGLVLLAAYDNTQAAEVFNGILAVDRNMIGAKWGVAEVLRRQHKLDKSEELCNEVIKDDPYFAPAYITLAYIEYIRMDFRRCIQLVTQVIRQGRGNVDLNNYTRAYALLSGANGMLAHYGGPIAKLIHGSQVMPNLKRAERLQPDSSAVLFGLGTYYLLAPAIAGENLNLALDYLNRAVKADPFFPDVYVRLAQAYKLKGDNKKYLAYLNKAFKLDPENELAIDTKSGRCQYLCSP